MVWKFINIILFLCNFSTIRKVTEIKYTYEIQPTIAKINETDSKSSDVINLQALTTGDSVL
jgi:ribosomal protein L2